MEQDTERRRQILAAIAEDMAADAQRFDGQPLTGRTVAEYMGQHGAAIAALANIVADLLRVIELRDAAAAMLLRDVLPIPGYVEGHKPAGAR
jgi:hypothetical protein